MADLVITVRRPNGHGFDDRPGPARFLMVPADADTPRAEHAIPRRIWRDWAIVESGIHPHFGSHGRGDALFYIHGLNVGPEEALATQRRLAAGLRRVGFLGSVIGFQWPVSRTLVNYGRDRLAASHIALRLVRDGLTMLSLLQYYDCRINVHVLAHSAGAFLLREAFARAADHPRLQRMPWHLGHIALVSADIAAARFTDRNAKTLAMMARADRVTNYANRADRALRLSNAIMRLGVSPRIGAIGLPADAPAGATDVDCTAVYERLARLRGDDSFAFSHSWQFSSRAFLRDLAHNMHGRPTAPATRRPRHDRGFSLLANDPRLRTRSISTDPVQ